MMPSSEVVPKNGLEELSLCVCALLIFWVPEVVLLFRVRGLVRLPYRNSIVHTLSSVKFSFCKEGVRILPVINYLVQKHYISLE